MCYCPLMEFFSSFLSRSFKHTHSVLWSGEQVDRTNTVCVFSTTPRTNTYCIHWVMWYMQTHMIWSGLWCYVYVCVWGGGESLTKALVSAMKKSSVRARWRGNRTVMQVGSWFTPPSMVVKSCQSGLRRVKSQPLQHIHTRTFVFLPLFGFSIDIIINATNNALLH